MTVLQILKSESRTFNKCGYKLANVVELSVPEKASTLGANKIIKATVEHISGEKKAIETWLGKDGKTLRTIHVSTAKPNEAVVTDYNWSAPKIYNNDGDIFEKAFIKKYSPYTYENTTGTIKRRVLVKPEGELKYQEQKSIYTNLDINNKHKTVTKSIGTVEDIYNTSEIYSIQSGKKVKGLELKAEKQEDGLYKTVNTNYFGISNEDAQKVFSDEYFHSRFLPNTKMAECCVAQAAKNQRVSYTPKLIRSHYDRSYADYTKRAIALSQETCYKNRHYFVIDTLEHESTHLRQNELVEKYLKGELTDPQEIELAKQYKHNFDNYISPYVDEEGYYKQLLEDEAYEAGGKAAHLYFEITKQLRKLFDFSSFHSVGA